jgi:hypothetical protein
MVYHVLEVADNQSGFQILPACGYQRLVHMKSDCEGALDVIEVDAALRQIDKSAT